MCHHGNAGHPVGQRPRHRSDVQQSPDGIQRVVELTGSHAAFQDGLVPERPQRIDSGHQPVPERAAWPCRVVVQDGPSDQDVVDALRIHVHEPHELRPRQVAGQLTHPAVRTSDVTEPGRCGPAATNRVEERVAPRGLDGHRDPGGRGESVPVDRSGRGLDSLVVLVARGQQHSGPDLVADLSGCDAFLDVVGGSPRLHRIVLGLEQHVRVSQ